MPDIAPRKRGDIFNCPYCGKEVIAKDSKHKTCGSYACCKQRLVDYNREQYQLGRWHGPAGNGKGPKRKCLRCDKSFRDGNYHICPKCRKVNAKIMENYTNAAIMA